VVEKKQNIKRQCRRAERMWRKTKLVVHYNRYRDTSTTKWLASFYLSSKITINWI